eukprot:m.9032 g.9032  ORF g.9032 m.9032 type:complete len:435 (-) comp9346_c0_seq1:24-1328(-)
MSLPASPRTRSTHKNRKPSKRHSLDDEDPNNANFNALCTIKTQSLRALYEQVEDADVAGVTAAGVQSLIEKLLSSSPDTDGYASFDTLVERAVSIQHAERVLERLDIDCDGVLSFEEFKRCLEHMLDEEGKPRNFHFSLLHADNMVLQDACDEALHVQNLLGHKLDALEREHELMVTDLEERLQQREKTKDHVVQRAQTDLAHMHAQMLAMQQQLTDAKQHAEQLQDGSSYANSHLQVLSLASVRSRSNSIWSNLSSIQGDINEDSDNCTEADLRDQLSTSHYQVQTLQTELAEASTMILEFSEKVSVQEQEITSLTRELTGLRHDLNDIESFERRRCVSVADINPTIRRGSGPAKLAWQPSLDDTLYQSLPTRGSQPSLHATTTVAFFTSIYAIGWMVQRGSSWTFEQCNNALSLALLTITYLMHLVDALLPG